MLYYLNVIRSTEKKVSVPMKREFVVLSNHKTMAQGCWVGGKSSYIQRIRNHHYGHKEEVMMEAYGKDPHLRALQKRKGKEIKSFLDCLVWIISAVSEVLGLAVTARLTGHMNCGPEQERHKGSR